MDLGIGVQFAQIGAGFVDYLGRPGLQLSNDADSLKSLVRSLIELKQDFINTTVHRIDSSSERERRLTESKRFPRCRASTVLRHPLAHTDSAAIENPTE